MEAKQVHPPVENDLVLNTIEVDEESDQVNVKKNRRKIKKERDPTVSRFQLCCKHPLGTFTRAQALAIVYPLAFVYVLGFQMYNVSIYTISVYYNISTTIAQLFPVSQNIINTAFCFFNSPLTAKLGMRNLVIICFLVGGILNLLMPWGPFIYSLMIRILTDFMYALIGPTRSPLIRATASPEKFRVTMSLSSSLQCINAVVSPLLAGLFCDSKISWFGIPLFIGSCSLLVSLYFFFVYPKIPKPGSIANNSNNSNGAASNITTKTSLFVNPKFDVIGSILLVILILSLCVLLVEFSMLPVWLLITLSCVFVVSVILYVLHEKHLKSGRIIPFELFKNKRFMLNLVCSSIGIGSLRGPSILAPLVMQQIYGFSSTLTGLINAITIPLGQLLCGILLSIYLRKVKPHILQTLFLFLDGLCGILLCLSMLLPTPIPLILAQFLSSYVIYTVNSIGGQNSMIFADPKSLSIFSCVQEMATSMGGVIGQFIAVTIRDIISPIFSDPTNPLSNNGIRTASMISGIIIYCLVLLACPIAYSIGKIKAETKPQLIQNAALCISNSGSEEDGGGAILSISNSDQSFITESLEQEHEDVGNIKDDVSVDNDNDTSSS